MPEKTERHRSRTRKRQRTSDPLLRIVESIRKETSELLDQQHQAGSPITFETIHGARITGWLHEPTRRASDAVLVELHGGGIALGDPRKEDALLEWVAQRWGLRTLGLGYRLAPENPFPAAYDDVVDTLAMLADGSLLGEPVSKICLLGYSAGAELALAAAALSGVPTAGQLLYYPYVEAAEMPDRSLARDLDVPYDLVVAFNRWYSGGVADLADPRISPARLADEDLARLPRTVIYSVREDALFASSQLIAERMAAQGVEVAFHVVEGLWHGYVEDLVNLELYRELNPPDQIEARGGTDTTVAVRTLVEGFAELLGEPACDLEPAFMRG